MSLFVLVHGLYMDSMRWNDDSMLLIDLYAGEVNPTGACMLSFVYVYACLCLCLVSVWVSEHGLNINTS